MRRRRSCWCLTLAALTALAVLVSAAPAAAVDYELRATVTLPYQPRSALVPTGVDLKKGTRYRFVISGLGTMTDSFERPDLTVETHTVEQDAFYSYCASGTCGSRPTQANPTKGSPIGMTGIFEPTTSDSILSPNFGATAPPPSFANHTYTVDFPVWDDREMPLLLRANAPSTYDSVAGSFTVQVFSEVQCPVFATVTKIVGDLGVLRPGPGEDWQTGRLGQRVCKDYEIHTGPDSEVTLKFPDTSEVTVKELTELKILTLFKQSDRIKTDLMLRIGEIQAKVKRQEVIRADFSVQTPTAAASVRGTVFRVKHDPLSKISTVATSEGKVSVNPTGKGKTVLVGKGQVVDVTKSGARAVSTKTLASRDLARALAVQRIIDASPLCKVSIPREDNVVGVTASGRDWRVTVLTNLGTTTWLVSGNVRVTPTNALAKRIEKGCK